MTVRVDFAVLDKLPFKSSILVLEMASEEGRYLHIYVCVTFKICIT